MGGRGTQSSPHGVRTLRARADRTCGAGAPDVQVVPDRSGDDRRGRHVRPARAPAGRAAADRRLVLRVFWHDLLAEERPTMSKPISGHPVPPGEYTDAPKIESEASGGGAMDALAVSTAPPAAPLRAPARAPAKPKKPSKPSKPAPKPAPKKKKKAAAPKKKGGAKKAA